MAMTNEDVARAAIHALGEVADLTRGAILGTGDDMDAESMYVREQLNRVKDLAEWSRDHLDNLTDAEFVRQQTQADARRRAEYKGGGS